MPSGTWQGPRAQPGGASLCFVSSRGLWTRRNWRSIALGARPHPSRALSSITSFMFRHRLLIFISRISHSTEHPHEWVHLVHELHLILGRMYVGPYGLAAFAGGRLMFGLACFHFYSLILSDGHQSRSAFPDPR